jgi:hypothetical protein
VNLEPSPHCVGATTNHYGLHTARPVNFYGREKNFAKAPIRRELKISITPQGFSYCTTSSGLGGISFFRIGQTAHGIFLPFSSRTAIPFSMMANSSSEKTELRNMRS